MKEVVGVMVVVCIFSVIIMYFQYDVVKLLLLMIIWNCVGTGISWSHSVNTHTSI